LADKIVYEIIDTPVGEMVVGATENGCCLCEFGDRGGLDRIKARLLKRYGVGPTEGQNKHTKQLKTELLEFFEQKRKSFTVTIDQKGSSFQKKVWDQLCKIPYGETRSYGQVAEAIGQPGGSRAVGRANGDNYIAIVVPCHRVIQADGSLRGYGGGLWRKKFLLELEQGVRTKTFV
jgi:AraC family transcriptional regulator of adaptative response/methylated-DNA-[protein]-cysteine methyltransferase